MNTNLSVDKANSLDIIETLTEGFELFKKNPGKLCLLTFVAMIVSLFSLGLLSGVMFMNILGIAKRLDNSIEGSYEPEISELFQRMDRFVDTFIIIAVIFGICVAMTVVLSIIGLAGSIVGFAIMHAVVTPCWLLCFQILNEEDGVGGLEIFKSVFNFIQKAPMKILGFGAVLGVIMAVPMLFGLFLHFICSILTCAITVTSGRVLFKKII